MANFEIKKKKKKKKKKAIQGPAKRRFKHSSCTVVAGGKSGFT
jgi:hypothetical protein